MTDAYEVCKYGLCMMTREPGMRAFNSFHIGNNDLLHVL